MSRARQERRFTPMPAGRWPAEIDQCHVHEKNGQRFWFVRYRNGNQTTVNYFCLDNPSHRAPIEATAEALGLEVDGDAVKYLIENRLAARGLVGWTGYVDIIERNGKLRTDPVPGDQA